MVSVGRGGPPEIVEGGFYETSAAIWRVVYINPENGNLFVVRDDGERSQWVDCWTFEKWIVRRVQREQPGLPRKRTRRRRLLSACA